jgi:hypothetical protein
MNDKGFRRALISELRLDSSAASFLHLFEVQLTGNCDISFQNFFHLFECVLIFFLALRDYAVSRYEEPEVAHVGIVGGKEDAVIARDAGEYQTTTPDVSE